jgi:putative phosphoribosyl transferase
MMKLFGDRRQAGRVLAQHLVEYRGRPDVIVLGLPRGGVPVAFEVATAIHAPLDVFMVRKIGAPWNEEFALGAIASGGLVYLDRDTVSRIGVEQAEIERIVAMESRELARREQLYRGARPFPDLTGLTVILVDDGLATGSSMLAAVHAVRTENPREVVAATPVASTQACELLSQVVDRCVCPATPEPFYGVGMWYDDFSETSDGEVVELLQRAAELQHSGA